MTELTVWIGILVRQNLHFRQTENECTTKSVVQKKRGRPPNPCLPDPVISFRLDCDLELQLEHWRSLRPKSPSRSRAIRVFLEGRWQPRSSARMALLIRRQKNRAQEPDARG